MDNRVCSDRFYRIDNTRPRKDSVDLTDPAGWLLLLHPSVTLVTPQCGTQGKDA